jgi:hypothetical protein
VSWVSCVQIRRDEFISVFWECGRGESELIARGSTFHPQVFADAQSAAWKILMSSAFALASAT